MKKRVLIITYYWPPSGGIGVHRCLKFAKYLRNYGWEPVICAPDNPEYPVLDYGNFKDVPEEITTLKTKIWEPYAIFKMITGKKKEDKIHNVFLQEEKAGIATKIGIWIRGNLFIPDARRFWINPTVQYLTKYLKDHPVEAMFTNGPPHSTHMIAYGVKRNLNIPWHADFQDPWTQVDYFPQLMLNPVSKMIHEKMEQRIFKYADKVTICSNSWKTDLEQIGAKDVDVIVWGYDENDFESIPHTLSEKFTLSHFGSLGPDRNASTLWQVLSEICKENPRFKKDLEIELVGFIGHAIVDEIEKLGLKENLTKLEHIPRAETLVKMCASQALLLILNDMPNVMGRLPGKLFEYLASRRPVIVIGPEQSDASKIVQEVNAGLTCGFNDYEKTKSVVLEMYDKYKKNDLPYNQTDISHYSNMNLTGKLASYLDIISSKNQGEKFPQ